MFQCFFSFLFLIIICRPKTLEVMSAMFSWEGFRVSTVTVEMVLISCAKKYFYCPELHICILKSPQPKVVIDQYIPE
ncbi:hypothetical protein PRUPE_1G102700 [Prunus persica]|uniref:Secreted protein n=1 Tax=Prunus persica TaxID=3760 RepID=A0A251QVF1_PRUPE|nr:hypothetical protein PRUPE_1G102700 [Prunus persica]